MKIRINRTIRLNTGNFTFIENNVELEDDVTKDTLKERYKALSNVLDAMLAVENLKTLDEMESINKVAFGSKKESINIDGYTKELKKAIPEIAKTLEENIKKL